MTDDQLVEGAKKGDLSAFEELVIRYQKAVYYFVLRILKDPQEAEDTVQKVFLLAFKNIRTFRAESSFKTWIYKIGLNQCHNFFRTVKNREQVALEDLPLADGKADPEGDVSDKELSLRLKKAVEKLPYKQRLVVTLRIYEELPFEEIGKVLGMRTNSAKVNFHHALEKLRVLMNEEREG
jgi:RNA polymerase sigma-70 factor (ECF subfamily)